MLRGLTVLTPARVTIQGAAAAGVQTGLSHPTCSFMAGGQVPRAPCSVMSSVMGAVASEGGRQVVSVQICIPVSRTEGGWFAQCVADTYVQMLYG